MSSRWRAARKDTPLNAFATAVVDTAGRGDRDRIVCHHPRPAIGSFCGGCAPAATSNWSAWRAPAVIGTGLTRHLIEAGIDVVEVCRLDRTDRRRRGKSDTIDAENAACAALNGERIHTSKSMVGQG